MTATSSSPVFDLAYKPEARRKCYYVLLLVIYDRRADHLKASGHVRDTTPHLYHPLP